MARLSIYPRYADEPERCLDPAMRTTVLRVAAAGSGNSQVSQVNGLSNSFRVALSITVNPLFWKILRASVSTLAGLFVSADESRHGLRCPRLILLDPSEFVGKEQAVMVHDPAHVAGLVCAQEEWGAVLGLGAEELLDGLHGRDIAMCR